MDRRKFIHMGASGIAGAVAATASEISVSAAQSAAAPRSPMEEIRAVDYTIIFAHDMKRMRDFYEDIMKFPLNREPSSAWVEYKVGNNLLVLSPVPAGGIYPEAVTPDGVASLQLAFRVGPGTVDKCADTLKSNDIAIIGEPWDQPWGHRTLFFRDPDRNILEIYADI